MSIDYMNVQFIPETLVVPHLSWVRKFPRGFAPTDGMIYFGGWLRMARPCPLMAGYCSAL